MTDPPPIALDTGSGITKVGFAGENFPTCVLPTVVGRPLMRGGRLEELLGEDIDVDDVMVGDECTLARGCLELSHPVRNGIIRDWDDVDLLWKHAFYDCLRINPRERMIVTSESPFNPIAHREKIVEIMLEDFGFTHLYFGIEAVLILFTQGLLTGLAVDCGEGTTSGVPVYEGAVLSHSARRYNCAGADVTTHLVNLLRRRGYHFNATADWDIVQEMKEKMCYIACDLELEKRLAHETCTLEQKFELPDKSVVTIGPERWEAPEVLFKPDLIDKETLGLGQLCYKTVQDSAIDVRRALYNHIVLSGASTLFPGLPTRIEKELKEKYLRDALKGDKTKLKNWKLNIDDLPARKNLVWMGAAVCGEILQRDKRRWISQEDWAEEGKRILWEKCPA
eukprot:TRINITY_DN23598_c0_g1_i1.p1 TRINITY_DN23598_c0_g1~~TRINITY_DN23598_c0_g1_i1.p1  ORF type:complete len:394 (+),score=29.60 TRINITY_DN23598_c0_g1_i1:29-1210(+)